MGYVQWADLALCMIWEAVYSGYPPHITFAKRINKRRISHLTRRSRGQGNFSFIIYLIWNKFGKCFFEDFWASHKGWVISVRISLTQLVALSTMTLKPFTQILQAGGPTIQHVQKLRGPKLVSGFTQFSFCIYPQIWSQVDCLLFRKISQSSVFQGSAPSTPRLCFFL